MLIKLRKRSVQFIEQEKGAAYSNISCSMRGTSDGGKCGYNWYTVV